MVNCAASDCTCPRYRYFNDNERERGLLAFHYLDSLCWRSPHADDLETLAGAIRNNAKHLYELELDFVNWQTLRGDLGYDSDDEGEGLGFFVGSMLQLGEPVPGPVFVSLRDLSLCQVPLSAVMARTIKFDTLRSLTLRKCPDWHRFIERVVRLGHPIRLKALEIQDCEYVSGTMGEYALEVFLEAFKGLEELFLDIPRPTSTLELWNCVAIHQATLKRFVQHHTVVGRAGELASFEGVDLLDRGLHWHDLSNNKEKPWNNPLMGLDLEFIGVNYIPEPLGPILLPFTHRPSLKIIHIRQSGCDLQQYPCWAVDEGVPTSVVTGTSDADTSSAISASIWKSSHLDNVDTAVSEAEVARAGVATNHGLRDQFYRFAEWAFGPQGLVTLEAIAYGGFAQGGRVGRHSFVLCRTMGDESGFRLLNQDGPGWKALMDRYCNALEACPDEPPLVNT
ncbi:hypothetical protein NCS55_00768700 [Fusarium keratoplasticum]|nr:hypothetical protein NCS55_00768700 [Fusarium keratoplasticum]